MSHSRKDGRKHGAHRHHAQGRVGGQLGRDLWGARPMAGYSHCPYAKMLCRRKERRQGKHATD